MRCRLAGCLLLLTWHSQLGAEEPSATPSADQIKALISQLHSPNEVPTVRGRASAKYPPGYDREAQKKIEAAFNQLHRLGLSTFPYLFEHFNDKSYSLTGDGGETDKNVSVGDA